MKSWFISVCFVMLHWVASRVTARRKCCLIPQFSSSSPCPHSCSVSVAAEGHISGTHCNSRTPWSRSLPSTCSTQSFTSALIGLVNATSTATSLFTFASPRTWAKRMLVRPGSQCSFLSEPFQKRRYYERLWWTTAECEQNISFREGSAHKELSLFPATAVTAKGIYLYVDARIIQGDVSFHKHLNPIFYMT